LFLCPYLRILGQNCLSFEQVFLPHFISHSKRDD
jgi:hypothetical protein